jgi:hypothetical protein
MFFGQPSLLTTFAPDFSNRFTLSKKITMKRIFLFLLVGFTIASCKNSNSTATDTTTTTESTQQAEQPKMKKYVLTPSEPSVEFADAKIESSDFKKGKYTFKISGKTYKLGIQTSDAPQKMCANSAQGQHLHLIVDDQPYAAKYTADFDYEIPDGEHYVLSFLSRSYHESIKTSAAYQAEKVEVKGNSYIKRAPIDQPMLFYSRPKGEYIGNSETGKVMLDFYLVNTTLGADYKVKAEINDQVEILESWQPYYIEGLPMGENKIKLTLIDKDGNAVSTPLNPVERTFTLKEDPAPGQ